MADPTFRLRNLAPPDLPRDPATRLLFYEWVRDIGLRVKDGELARGLDKDGKPLRPISPKTREHRRSAMTPDGKGDPSAPPLMPARVLSRTRSLLAGRATADAAIFYWRFDAFTGRSWGEVLAIHRRKGRDVIGLSPKGVARVRALAWGRWREWRRGEPIPALATSASPGIPRVGSYSTESATFGIGANAPPAFAPGQSTGGMTWPEWRKYFTQPNPAPVAIPGRPSAAFPRILAHVWGTGGPPGPTPPAPPRPAPRPKAPKPPAAPAPVRTFDDLAAHAASRGYEVVRTTTEEVMTRFGYDRFRASGIAASYDPADRRIHLNATAEVWRSPDPAAYRAAMGRNFVRTDLAGIVDHEIGHARHHAAIGDAFLDPSLRDERWQDRETPEGLARLRELVDATSAYAATMPAELVAEVYSGLVAGRAFPAWVMGLYRGLGGPIP